MGHSVDWYQKNRVIHAVVYSKELTLPSLQVLNRQLLALIQTSSASCVHVVIDLSLVQSLRASSTAILAGFEFASAPQVGSIMIVSPNPAVALRRLISRSYKRQVRGFPALEEAIFFVADEERALEMSYYELGASG